jgi:hypothetical protein
VYWGVKDQRAEVDAKSQCDAYGRLRASDNSDERGRVVCVNLIPSSVQRGRLG